MMTCNFPLPFRGLTCLSAVADRTVQQIQTGMPTDSQNEGPGMTQEFNEKRAYDEGILKMLAFQGRLTFDVWRLIGVVICKP